MASRISIKKAKLKDNLFIEVQYDEHFSNDVTNSISRSSTAPVHEDLVAAFDALKPHLALICEEIPGEVKSLEALSEMQISVNGKISSPTLFGGEVETSSTETLMDRFRVGGFVLSGYGDSEGVVLIGNKRLSGGKMVNLTSPFTKWLDEYNYTSDLAEAIEACKYEIIEFLVNGKQAPDRQLAMFDGESNGEEGYSE